MRLGEDARCQGAWRDLHLGDYRYGGPGNSSDRRRRRILDSPRLAGNAASLNLAIPPGVSPHFLLAHSSDKLGTTGLAAEQQGRSLPRAATMGFVTRPGSGCIARLRTPRLKASLSMVAIASTFALWDFLDRSPAAAQVVPSTAGTTSRPTPDGPPSAPKTKGDEAQPPSGIPPGPLPRSGFGLRAKSGSEAPTNPPPAPVAAPPEGIEARRVRVGDERGHPLVARVYGGPDSRVVMLPDGQLGWPNAFIYTEEPFRPLTSDELRDDLLAKAYEGFKVHQTKHYLSVLRWLDPVRAGQREAAREPVLRAQQGARRKGD